MVTELSQLEAEPCDLPTCDIEDAALIVYTSGTTGHPKGARSIAPGPCFESVVRRRGMGAIRIGSPAVGVALFSPARPGPRHSRFTALAPASFSGGDLSQKRL